VAPQTSHKLFKPILLSAAVLKMNKLVIWLVINTEVKMKCVHLRNLLPCLTAHLADALAVVLTSNSSLLNTTMFKKLLQSEDKADVTANPLSVWPSKELKTTMVATSVALKTKMPFDMTIISNKIDRLKLKEDNLSTLNQKLKIALHSLRTCARILTINAYLTKSLRYSTSQFLRLEEITEARETLWLTTITQRKVELL
jgi:hypothetical protein